MIYIFLMNRGAVGRPEAHDDMEFYRSVETLRIVADDFKKVGIRGAIKYIEALDNPGIRHINGDVYHMLVEEPHIGKAIVEAGHMLTNLHMADTNRGALGTGCLNLDTIIKSLYIIEYNNDDSCFVTPEPLGPGGDPYPAMYGRTDKELLDNLVGQTVRYFKEREEVLLS